MAKSFKYKDDNYLDSTGIVHNRRLLSTLITDILTDITYLRNRCKYSTSEIAVGTWINNKTIYRKVLRKTNNTSRDVSLPTPTNIDFMTDIRVIAKNRNSQEIITIPQNSISYATGNTPRGVTYLTHSAEWNKDNIYVVEVADYSEIYAIIEYTKN